MVPSEGDRTGSSIFIASRMTTGSPLATRRPGRPRTRTTVAGIGDESCCAGTARAAADRDVGGAEGDSDRKIRPFQNAHWSSAVPATYTIWRVPSTSTTNVPGAADVSRASPVISFATRGAAARDPGRL